MRRFRIRPIVQETTKKKWKSILCKETRWNNRPIVMAKAIEIYTKKKSLPLLWGCRGANIPLMNHGRTYLCTHTLEMHIRNDDDVCKTQVNLRIGNRRRASDIENRISTRICEMNHQLLRRQRVLDVYVYIYFSIYFESSRLNSRNVCSALQTARGPRCNSYGSY